MQDAGIGGSEEIIIEWEGKEYRASEFFKREDFSSGDMYQILIDENFSRNYAEAVKENFSDIIQKLGSGYLVRVLTDKNFSRNCAEAVKENFSVEDKETVKDKEPVEKKKPAPEPEPAKEPEEKPTAGEQPVEDKEPASAGNE